MYTLSRRGMLAFSAKLVPAMGLIPLAARGASAAACADPADSLRSSLHYQEASTDPANKSPRFIDCLTGGSPLRGCAYNSTDTASGSTSSR